MTSITVLGGGISGLSAAFYLARRFPTHSGVRITLVEKYKGLGGWIRAERVQVGDVKGHKAEILLESGPRTLRPTSKAILELINLLNLTSSIVTVPRSAPAARNRFLHIPGTKGLETIPSTPLALLASPLGRILIPALVRDVMRSRGEVLNSTTLYDESVDEFLTRHFGIDFAQLFGSALIHGIYAADTRMLSVRATFPVLCRMEEIGRGSLVRGALKQMLPALRPRSKEKAAAPYDVYDLGEVPQLVRSVSVYSFRGGMQTLTQAMAEQLRAQDNVEVLEGDPISAMGRSADGRSFEIATESGRRISSSHIVSAMPLPSLHRVLEHSATTSDPTHSALPSLPHLLANPTSSVTVVNLVFPPSRTPIHPPGFGYLVPRPRTDYRPSSTLGILGTVFDSCALSAQDVDLSPTPDPRDAFTKVTVMLGGPHGPPSPPQASADFLPALLATLQAHLGRAEPLPAPCAVRVHEHRDCIPTPTVGHVARMQELAAAVHQRWGSNAAVIGAGVGGVSVGDCVEGGRKAALTLEV